MLIRIYLKVMLPAESLSREERIANINLIKQSEL